MGDNGVSGTGRRFGQVLLRGRGPGSSRMFLSIDFDSMIPARPIGRTWPARPARNGCMLTTNRTSPGSTAAAGSAPPRPACYSSNGVPPIASPLTLSNELSVGLAPCCPPARAPWRVTSAPLLPVGTLDANQGALKDATFTLVGYGVEIGDRKAQEVVTERRFTTWFLKNVQDEMVTFQINDRDSKDGGGSCFSDSVVPCSSVSTWPVMLRS